MTARLETVELLHRDEIVAPPKLGQSACEDHNFELPTGIYAAMGLCFAGAVFVLAMAFRTHMGVAFAVIAAFLGAFFAIPVLFVKSSGTTGSTPLSWRRFRDAGIATATGHTSAGEATVLVLMLPVFILGFAVGISIIAAVVR